ncbi:hypothetical protein [Gluconobacter morbifer]|nr:hypothetical protein [Gluconobacter morbifer]
MQVSELTVLFRANMPWDQPMTAADTFVSEIEARCAEEQRRKDAEGKELIDLTALKAEQGFDCDEGRLDPGVLDKIKKGRLTPANVAALEARVKVLEDAINAACERLSAPAWTICANTHCERADECRSPAECGGTGKPGALRILRAALTREGGE